jgi:hypothetical protein
MDLDTVWIRPDLKVESVLEFMELELLEFLFKTCSIRGLPRIFQCFQK